MAESSLPAARAWRADCQEFATSCEPRVRLGGPRLAPMTQARLRLGRRAEDLVAARLTAQGWRIVERNARTRFGELDIVALEGLALVFVEVKAGREGSGFGPERPVLAVDARKRRRLRSLAAAWMAERRLRRRYEEIRIDAIGVTFDRIGHPVDFEHIRSAA
jgi:putative endonuclease